MSHRTALSFVLALCVALPIAPLALAGSRSPDCDDAQDEAACHSGTQVRVRVGPFGDVEVDVEGDDDHDADRFDLSIDFFSWDEDDGETSLKILDLLLFSLVESRSREPDHSHLEVLQAPLITGFESRRDGENHRIQLLDIPFFTLFRSERRAGESDLRIVDLPIVGSLFRQQVSSHKRRTDVLFLFRFVRPVTAADPSPAP